MESWDKSSIEQTTNKLDGTNHLPTDQGRERVLTNHGGNNAQEQIWNSNNISRKNLTFSGLPPGRLGGPHPAGGRRLAVRRVLEERFGEALVRVPDVEQDDPGLVVVDEDALDGEPHEELLLRQPLHAAERADAEVAADNGVKVGQVAVVVRGVARRRQPRLEQPVGLVHGVRLHAAREQAAGEAVIGEQLVYWAAVAGVAWGGAREHERRRGEQKEAQEGERGEMWGKIWELCHGMEVGGGEVGWGGGEGGGEENEEEEVLRETQGVDFEVLEK